MNSNRNLCYRLNGGELTFYILYAMIGKLKIGELKRERGNLLKKDIGFRNEEKERKSQKDKNPFSRDCESEFGR